MSENFTELAAHDLWITAREFEVDISRPTTTTALITITRPTGILPGRKTSVVDGAVLLLNSQAFSPNDYPVDGTTYTPSTVYGDVAASYINSAQVVGFWSGVLGAPFPTGTPDTTSGTATYTVTVTGLSPTAVYSASIHACSNVLQYYPLGIQSYPIPGVTPQKDPSAFAGSIPSLPSAPTSPASGTVYFDQQLNVVQYWDATQQVWIPTRTDTIISGDINPGILGQAYIVAGNVLQIGRAHV